MKIKYSYRFLLFQYLERCSRYEKAVDNRLKETRLMQRVTYSESESTVPSLKGTRLFILTLAFKFMVYLIQ